MTFKPRYHVRGIGFGGRIRWTVDLCLLRINDKHWRIVYLSISDPHAVNADIVQRENWNPFWDIRRRGFTFGIGEKNVYISFDCLVGKLFQLFAPSRRNR